MLLRTVHYQRLETLYCRAHTTNTLLARSAIFHSIRVINRVASNRTYQISTASSSLIHLLQPAIGYSSSKGKSQTIAHVMLLNLPVEVRFIVYRNLTPQEVGHSVVSLTEKPSLVSNDWQYLRVASSKGCAEYKISHRYLNLSTKFLGSVRQFETNFFRLSTKNAVWNCMRPPGFIAGQSNARDSHSPTRRPVKHHGLLISCKTWARTPNNWQTSKSCRLFTERKQSTTVRYGHIQ